MKPTLPQITHLQFVALRILGSWGLQEASKIRLHLEDFAGEMSGPAFYQFMRYMDRAKLVEGFFLSVPVNGVHRRCRFYKITKHGKEQEERTLNFYHKFTPNPDWKTVKI